MLYSDANSSSCWSIINSFKNPIASYRCLSDIWLVSWLYRLRAALNIILTLTYSQHIRLSCFTSHIVIVYSCDTYTSSMESTLVRFYTTYSGIGVYTTIRSAYWYFYWSICPFKDRNSLNLWRTFSVIFFVFNMASSELITTIHYLLIVALHEHIADIPQYCLFVRRIKSTEVSTSLLKLI